MRKYTYRYVQQQTLDALKIWLENDERTDANIDHSLYEIYRKWSDKLKMLTIEKTVELPIEVVEKIKRMNYNV